MWSFQKTIQIQQAYEFRKAGNAHDSRPAATSSFPLEQNITSMFAKQKKAKRKQILRITISILLSMLFIILEFMILLGATLP